MRGSKSPVAEPATQAARSATMPSEIRLGESLCRQGVRLGAAGADSGLTLCWPGASRTGSCWPPERVGVFVAVLIQEPTSSASAAESARSSPLAIPPKDKRSGRARDDPAQWVGDELRTHRTRCLGARDGGAQARLFGCGRDQCRSSDSSTSGTRLGEGVQRTRRRVPGLQAGPRCQLRAVVISPSGTCPRRCRTGP